MIENLDHPTKRSGKNISASGTPLAKGPDPKEK
jgi:hypothetical protein